MILNWINAPHCWTPSAWPWDDPDLSLWRLNGAIITLMGKRLVWKFSQLQKEKKNKTSKQAGKQATTTQNRGGEREEDGTKEW